MDLRDIKYEDIKFADFYPNGSPKPIGEGNFAFVYRGEYNDSQIAIKQFKKSDTKISFIEEAHVMRYYLLYQFP